MNTNGFQIGDKVIKLSGKPFKSQLKVGTIKSFCINEQDPKKLVGAMFEEDSSIVSIDKLTHAV